MYRQQQPGQFQQPGFPGFPGGGFAQRLNQIERQLNQLTRRVDRLDRRLDRVERRLGIPTFQSDFAYAEDYYY
jgi:hypothetical protein